jgi:hypothetical protein
MTVYVAPIVEGETEMLCIKVLLSRVWRELIPGTDAVTLAVLDPIIADRSACAKVGHPELEEQVERAARSLRAHTRRQAFAGGFILLILDADEDCPAKLSSVLRDRANAARTDILTACVMPNRLFENWFKASAASLCGYGGLPGDMITPADPEVGSGDTWLTEQKKRVDPNAKYKKPDDALKLARHMDLALCHQHSRSFRKLCKELAARVPALPPPQPEPPVGG